MKTISFKAKLVAIVISIIFVTIMTSYLSANVYISRYIHKADTSFISSQIETVRNVIADKIESNIVLAKSTKFSFSEVKQAAERTGFHDAVKVAFGMAISKEGKISDEALTQKYLNLLAQANGKVMVTDVYFQNKKPLITIIVPEGEEKGNLFVVDLTPLGLLLKSMSVDGSYLELMDAKNSLVFSNKIDGNITPISQTFDVAGKTWTLTGFIDNDYIQNDTDSLNNRITIALIIAGIILIPIAFLLINWVMKPILLLKNLIADLANGNGDLTHRLQVDTRDELGMIAQGINQFISNLQTMMKQVKQSTESISQEIRKLEEQTDSNGHLLHQHSMELDSTVTAINEMSSTASVVAENAANTANQTEMTNAEASQSREVVRQAVDNVSSLIDEVEETARFVSEMNEHTDEIGHLLGEIGGIAEQTNLLALNAAIEAARAGEQGRGFAVVADEVRALASRTHKSTEDIVGMLERLKSGTSTVVAGMESTKSSCRHTAETTGVVMSSLDKMTRSVTEINDLSVQIATSAEEQSSVTEDINRSMVNIREMMQRINENGDNTTETAQRLIQTNQQLSDIVSQFKIEA
ncbi:Methyl-accepting chemotaxis protein PctC [Vibrio aerogenes CECT 7868]|uniref:Methyl-accepting chemotaxis protein PctC n=1 Tax=Vibrio aerogenes CECT 7868 TaxID=1216006 RepID=A0A1M5V935_9VIBR|nr:methyl-accepting chemotaxis protein [Vibrio aerogenes]SHH71782.1 Methyl-accepting chemotaxis protein PctC [Vibrio aerogenes CECT 7868]